jgi:hypothetical protein
MRRLDIKVINPDHGKRMGKGITHHLLWIVFQEA